MQIIKILSLGLVLVMSTGVWAGSLSDMKKQQQKAAGDPSAEREKRLAKDKRIFKEYEAMWNGLEKEGTPIEVGVDRYSTKEYWLARGRLIEMQRNTSYFKICDGKRPWANKKFLSRPTVVWSVPRVRAKEKNGAYEFSDNRGVKWEINPAKGTCLYLGGYSKKVKACVLRNPDKTRKLAYQKKQVEEIREHCNKFYATR